MTRREDGKRGEAKRKRLAIWQGDKVDREVEAGGKYSPCDKKGTRSNRGKRKELAR